MTRDDLEITAAHLPPLVHEDGRRLTAEEYEILAAAIREGQARRALQQLGPVKLAIPLPLRGESPADYARRTAKEQS